jgi:hypothetical protein
MILAATATNLVHTQHILLAVSTTPTTRPVHGTDEDAWEGEGGRVRLIPSRAP